MHIEQLLGILADEEETCHQLAACAQEQQEALRQGNGPEFVRASLTQAHLARRLYFMEEERNAAVEALAHSLAEEQTGSQSLAALMERLPDIDATRLAHRSRRVRDAAEDAAAVQKVNAQMVQTNIQLAAALTRQMVNSSDQYYSAQAKQTTLPPSQLDRRI
jgi:hypothetical protein